MNICLVSQNYPPDTAQGGIGTQTWNKALALASLGHRVHVLACAARQGPDPRTETKGGITVHRIQAPGQGPGGEPSIYNEQTYWIGYTWSVLRHLHRLMQSMAFDVIDFPEYGGEGFAFQLNRSRWNWVPVVVQLHGPLSMLAEHIGWPEKESDLYQVGTFMEASSINHADALMACSANIADFTAGFYEVPRESIDVVHCGVDAERFRPPGSSERGGDQATVLFVGNIAPSKGVETVFEAVLRLRSKFPAIRLQILGNGDGELVKGLRSQAHARGATANIEFAGFIDRARLPEYYRQADVFCSPAQYEGGVANVYIEAMACGCPVVASFAGGAPEAVIDGQTGLLVPPKDIGGVAAALHRILGDASLRQRMGEAGRRRVEDYFAMDKYISRVLAVYEKAIGRSRQKLGRLKAEENS